MSISNDLQLLKHEIDRYIPYITDQENGRNLKIELVKIFEIELMANVQLKTLVSGQMAKIQKRDAVTLANEINENIFNLMYKQFKVTRDLNSEIISRHDNRNDIYKTAMELLNKNNELLDAMNTIFKRSKVTKLA